MTATASGERYFDNGGQTFDRYTIVIAGSVIGMSHNPTSPQGFNQYCGEVGEFDLDNDSIGAAVEWESLPEDVQKAILARLDADIIISRDETMVAVGDWGTLPCDHYQSKDNIFYNFLADMPPDLYKRVRERLFDAGLISFGGG